MKAIEELKEYIADSYNGDGVIIMCNGWKLEELITKALKEREEKAFKIKISEKYLSIEEWQSKQEYL